MVEIKKLSTPRLLAYYKAERKRQMNASEDDLRNSPSLTSIKEELDKRKHVKK